MYPGFHAVTQPDKPAVVMGRTGEMITYRELDERSVRLAQGSHAAAERPADRRPGRDRAA
jgi:long-chain acyl-CoA synthetase